MAEFSEYYDIFADFRFCGYKLQPDVITKIRNYNIATGTSAMHRSDDYEAPTEMIYAYLKNPVGNSFHRQIHNNDD